MLFGGCGLFWQRDLVDWKARGWRLLGRHNIKTGSIQVCDFRRARGVYVLYDDLGVFYVGLSVGKNGIGARLKDHTTDELKDGWTRFSWISFDSPASAPGPDGVYPVRQRKQINSTTSVAVRELEALLQAVTGPYSNRNTTHFKSALEWVQVATAEAPAVVGFDEIAHRL